MYQVTEDELNSLHNAGNYKTLDLALFALCAGILVTLIATLVTVEIKEALTLQGFIAAAFAAGLGTIFFGVRSFLAWRVARAEFSRIKRDDSPQV